MGISIFNILYADYLRIIVANSGSKYKNFYEANCPNMNMQAPYNAEVSKFTAIFITYSDF